VAGNTGFNVNAVDRAARQHEDTAEGIRSELSSIRTRLQEVMASSTNAMTQQLDQKAQDWITNVEKGVLTKMTEMAACMRQAVSGQDEADSHNRQQIMNLADDTMAFLGN
jgi:hypothetical protein